VTARPYSIGRERDETEPRRRAFSRHRRSRGLHGAVWAVAVSGEDHRQGHEFPPAPPMRWLLPLPPWFNPLAWWAVMKIWRIRREPVPIYEYRCQECGVVFSRLFRQSHDAGDQEICPDCGSGRTQRLVSLFAVGGRANPGPGRAAWPASWEDTNGADPETLRYWRRRIEREARLEEKYPELADPSLLHGSGTATPEPGHDHGHSHGGHGHHHHHGHSHAGTDGSATSTPSPPAGSET